MKPRYLITGAIAAIGAAAAPAHAEQYLAVRGGVSTDVSASGVSLDGGFAFEAAAGGKIGPVRVELRGGRMEADLAGAIDVSAWDLGATAFLDLDVGRGTFSAGGGASYVFANANFGFGGEDGEGAGWHYALAYARPLTETMAFEAIYRHTEIGDLDIAGGVATEADAFLVGLRFS